MNADSGSWLYILLSIVFLVLSAIGNKNKKKAEASTQPIDDEYEPAPSSEKHWPKSLEDVLSDVLDLPKQQEVIVERPQQRPAEVFKKDVRSYENIEDEAQSLETIEKDAFSYETPVEEKYKKPAFHSMAKPQETKKPEEIEPELLYSEFDLRQGIIYAEILNRKYF